MEPKYRTRAAIGIANAASRIIAFAAPGLLDRSTLAAGSTVGVIGIPPARIANRIVRRTGHEIHSRIISGIIIAPDSISSFWQLWNFSEAFSLYRSKPINFLPKQGNLSAAEHARQAAKLALEIHGCQRIADPQQTME